MSRQVTSYFEEYPPLIVFTYIYQASQLRDQLILFQPIDNNE